MIKIKDIKRFLNLESVEEKLARYEDLENRLISYESNLDSLSKSFYSEMSKFNKAVSDPDNFTIKDRLTERFAEFTAIHKSDIQKAHKEFKSIKTEKEKLENDPLIKKAIENYKRVESFNSIKKAYKEGNITADVYDSIIKGITKQEVVKYADFILKNEKGQILLLKRSEWEDNHKGAWVIPGGHVDPGEDFETAAKRELKEESGFDASDVCKCGEFKDGNVHIEYYCGTVNTEDQHILLDVFESRDYCWVDECDIEDYEMIFNMKDNILKILGIPPKEEPIILKSEELKSLYADLAIELHKSELKRDFLIEKGFIDEAEKINEIIEKAKKDISKLQKIKKLIYKNGKLILATYYVSTGETIAEANAQFTEAANSIEGDISVGDSVKFTDFKGNEIEGTVTGMCYDKVSKSNWVGLMYEGKLKYFNTEKVSGFVNNGSGIDKGEEYTFIKDLGGSTGAKLVLDSWGNKLVKKTGKDKEHLDTEYQANLIYKMFGVRVPEIQGYDKEKGELYTKFIEGTKYNDQYRSYLTKDFAVDALLANWDLIGLEDDNVICDNYYGHAYRVDVGGCLDKRAQGGDKEFGEEVKELDTLLDPNINPKTAHAFRELDKVTAIKSMLDRWDMINYDFKHNDAISDKFKDIIPKRVEYMRNVYFGLIAEQYNSVSIGYNGDIYDMKKDEDGESYYDDNIVKFYDKLNQDIKLNQEDLAILGGLGITEKYCENHFESSGLKNSTIYKEAIKHGVTNIELYIIRDYTGSESSSYNSVCTDYMGSESGNWNLTDKEHNSEKEQFEIKKQDVIVKKSINLLDYSETLKTAIKSFNYAVKEKGNHKEMNQSKVDAVSAAYNALSNLFYKVPSGSNAENHILILRDKMKDFLSSYNSSKSEPLPIYEHDPVYSKPVTYEETEVQDVKVPIPAKKSGFNYSSTYKKFIPKVKLLASGMKKLEAIKNKNFYKEGIFNRGIDLDYDEVKLQFKKEHEIQNKYVVHGRASSTSWETSGFSRNTKLKIAGEGVHINDISYHAGGESEVLLKPFTMFKTLDYKEYDPDSHKRVVHLLKIT